MKAKGGTKDIIVARVYRQKVWEDERLGRWGGGLK